MKYAPYSHSIVFCTVQFRGSNNGGKKGRGMYRKQWNGKNSCIISFFFWERSSPIWPQRSFSNRVWVPFATHLWAGHLWPKKGQHDPHGGGGPAPPLGGQTAGQTGGGPAHYLRHTCRSSPDNIANLHNICQTKPNQTKQNKTKPQTFLQIFLAATCQWVSQSVGQ